MNIVKVFVISTIVAGLLLGPMPLVVSAADNVVNAQTTALFRPGHITGIAVGIAHRRGYQCHVGEVLSYIGGSNIENGSITIRDKQGNIVVFTIIDGKFKILPPWHGEPQVGDWVTVISRAEPGQPEELVALGVVVHARKPAGLGTQLERVTGVIQISDGTITVNVTPPVVMNYDEATIFVLRGVPSADGQLATVFYEADADGAQLAKFVLVGIDISAFMTRIRERFRTQGGSP